MKFDGDLGALTVTALTGAHFILCPYANPLEIVVAFMLVMLLFGPGALTRITKALASAISQFPGGPPSDRYPPGTAPDTTAFENTIRKPWRRGNFIVEYFRRRGA